MKKLFTFLAVVFISAAACGVFAACGGNSAYGETGTVIGTNLHGLTFYLLSDGTCSVGVDGGDELTEIKIPEEYDGVTVTRVSAYAFYGLEDLTEVTIPATVTYIGDYAFAGCKNLQTINIGDEDAECYAVDDALYFDGGQIETGNRAFADTSVAAVYISDSDDGDTLVDVYANAGGEISSVKITAALNDETDIEFESSFDLGQYACSKQVDFGTYGLFKDIVVEFCTADGQTAATVSTSGVAVSADEYNIAQLNGTYGPLVFSLKLSEITQDGGVPTFVALERVDAYNWDALPYNMQYFPMVTYETATTDNFHDIREDIADYIAELYTINPDSRFTLYAVDNYAELYLQYFVANRIPESNYSVVLLSDGTATASWLSQIFGSNNDDTLAERYEALKENFEEIKQYVWDSGSYDAKEIYKMADFAYTKYEILAYYTYVIVNEESNFEWWVNRLRVGENLTAIAEKEGGSDFISEIRSVTTEYYTNNLLAALTDEQSAAFKTLYNFDENAFAEADEAGNKVMVILGTSWSAEKDYIYDYIKMTVDYYGGGYTYYYKPHPGYPTSSYPERQEILDKLAEEGYEIYELEASIAAEIFIYYFPDIYLSGWQSTTFYSVDQSQALAVYNIGKEAAQSDSSVATYYSNIDIFITSAEADELNETYGLNLDESRKYSYYLVEYNDSSAAQKAEYGRHEIAVYCISDDGETLTINYYKNVSDAWIQVAADGTAA